MVSGHPCTFFFIKIYFQASRILLFQIKHYHNYDWAITNNMFFNAEKFYYVSFNTDPTENKCNVYVNPKMGIIPHPSNVQDLGITKSSDCTFNALFHFS